MGMEETRKLTPVFYYAVCPRDGSYELVGFSGKFEYQFKHSCGNWTWEKGNYCGYCGQKINQN